MQKLISFALVLFTLLLTAAACSLGGGDPPPEEEPRFQPGEYGGDPLPGTEHLFNVRPSPSGDRIALIRERTPGIPSDPRNQLWITRRDGSNPELMGVNVLGADWSPDESQLALTVAIGIDFYVYTIELATRDTTQWTGSESDVLSEPTVSNPKWFKDGRRLLVSVFAKAYQQPFSRGIYTINTETNEVRGPLVELMEGARPGNEDRYAIGQKYVDSENSRSGNFTKFTFADNTWNWITDFSKDSLDLVGTPVPSPTSNLLVQSRETGNAEQLFLMNSEGENARRVTELGGDNPQWSPDGSYVVFRRDVHRGKGAHYLPFRFDLETMEAAPLWPALPDSVPDFPDLSTQTLNATPTRR
ncbi:MAG: hypothetical protein GVY35_01915 [Bacteroidetes bacterium]|jgi:Tol biopolymer transport system component|nr:hypothetical protein [Bacteroidota bacterium]